MTNDQMKNGAAPNKLHQVSTYRDIFTAIRRSALFRFIGIAAPAFALIGSIPNTRNAILDIVGLPSCFFYADAYYYHDGHFRKHGERWTEYQEAFLYQFEEMHRDKDYITLINKTPRTDARWRSMLVRLPTCGGTAQWSYQNPQQWIDLYLVSTKVSPSLTLFHERLEAKSR